MRCNGISFVRHVKWSAVITINVNWPGFIEDQVNDKNYVNSDLG